MTIFDAGKYIESYRKELYESVLPFWIEHSLDHEYGGYFNCLDADGTVYDTTKHMWLQCRQVWMLSRLYNELEKNPAWLEAARLGLDFIRRCGRTSQGRVYFSLTREGRPLFIQRKIFAECFYIIALDEFARASGEQSLQEEARELFDRVLAWRADPASLGRPVLEGQPAASSMAEPMMLLCVADQLSGGGNYRAPVPLMQKCLAEILLHVQTDRKLVLENVAPDGGPLPGSLGRLMNPGHAIEAGWFVLEHLGRTGDRKAAATAISMIDWSFERGWDPECEGIYYFMDSQGLPPFQLEWTMKLWWPHCEALIGLLMAYRETSEPHYLEKFERVSAYAFKHFSDARHGEWFGYLDRQGRLTHTLKGGPYKGFFHVPRMLLMCMKLLEQMA